MRFLLDTHAFLWLLLDDGKIDPSAKIRLGSADIIYVSAVSVWEICNKFHQKKLPEVKFFAHRLGDVIVEQGFTTLAIEVAHASIAAFLPNHHRDPWDRLLIAQALNENLTIVSNEMLFDRYNVPRLW